MGVGLRVTGWLASESKPQAVEEFSLNDFDESLLCKEIMGSNAPSSFNDPSHFPSGFDSNVSNPTENNLISSGFADLENLELDTPPELSLTVSYFFVVVSPFVCSCY